MMNLLQPLIPTYSFIFVALTILLFLAMSFSVIFFRFKEGVSFGAGNDPKSNLGKMVRVHGNFAEYAPLYLLALVAIEMTGAPKSWIWILGGLFLFSRLMHWKGMFYHKTPNLFRVTGMMITFGALIIMSLRLLWICLQ
jgi:uncharacterized protein